MANQTRQITIESILGGQSKYVNYAAEDEFLHSYNIDPDLTSGFTQSDGVISPTGVNALASNVTINGAPLWATVIPRSPTGSPNGLTYIYDAVGSVYTSSTELSVINGSTDLNDGGTATGNGAAYYDNYAYFSRDTTIARRGPLNGSPTWTDDYWVSTLGMTALTNTEYPHYSLEGSDFRIPNHVLHRHSDGKLYIADVVDNKGTIHYISTSKTTVEGDTNNGSTYNALDLPYGMWPTALASYGSDLVVAMYEGEVTTDPTGYSRAKLAFWDTISESYSLITTVEFPDPVIYALLNTNGVLYVFSGQISQTGVRVTRFAGGYTFEQVSYIDHAYPPLAGAVDGFLNRVLFGGKTTEPNPTVYDVNTTTTSQIPSNSYGRGCVWGIGSKKSPVEMSLFNVMGTSQTTSSTVVTAVKLYNQSGMDTLAPIVCWTDGTTHGCDTTLSASGDYSTQDLGGGTLSANASYGPPSVWRSQVYRIGQPHKITKISIPFVQRSDLGDGSAGLTVGILSDGGDSQSNYKRLIDYTGSFESRNRLVLRPNGLTADHRFVLELVFTSNSGSPYMRVGFPIVIEYELIDD